MKKFMVLKMVVGYVMMIDMMKVIVMIIMMMMIVMIAMVYACKSNLVTRNDTRLSRLV